MTNRIYIISQYGLHYYTFKIADLHNLYNTSVRSSLLLIEQPCRVKQFIQYLSMVFIIFLVRTLMTNAFPVFIMNNKRTI